MIPAMIVPTLNQHDRCRDMLRSIDHPVKDLVVINNDRRVAFEPDQPEKVERMTVLNMPSNLGVASSWNLGIKLTPFAPWWLIASDDVVFGQYFLAGMVEAAEVDRMVLLDDWPHFQAFTVGEDVVRQVGLFDEALHPANFEDDDYFRRVEKAGFRVKFLYDMPHFHVGQATVHSPEYAGRKAETYSSNERYLENKIERDDFTAGAWSLDRRRKNTLD